MTALRREGLVYAALAALAIAASCAKAENSPLADQGGDGEGGEDGGGKGGVGAVGGSAGMGARGGTPSTGGSAGKGGTTSTGGSSGKGGTTSTGGSTSNGGSSGTPSTTYGCLGDGEGGEGGHGGASGGAPGEAGAGGAGPGMPFFDDFEDGNANGWTPTSGAWSIVSDGSQTYEQSIVSSTSQYISAVGGTCWTDQIVEAKVNVVTFNGNSTSNAGSIFARYVNAQTHYLVGMNSGNNGELFIGKRAGSTSNAPERIAQENDMDWATDTWYTLRLEVVGSSLKAYLDDTLMLEATDEQITSGGVAVGARHVNVHFDDVKVTAP